MTTAQNATASATERLDVADALYRFGAGVDHDSAWFSGDPQVLLGR